LNPRSNKAFFVTGTDTGVGKTLVTCALIHACQKAGRDAVGLKPVAAGCELTDQGWRNEDAILIQSAMSIPLSYHQVNPVALAPAIAPHLAAQQSGQIIQLASLIEHCQAICDVHSPVFIEGAGGWRVPLNEKEGLSGVAVALSLPVILVVGVRLGCLNHAALTYEAILADGLPLVGWVANIIDPDMPCSRENIDSLQQILQQPPLAVLPFSDPTDPEQLAQKFIPDQLRALLA